MRISVVAFGEDRGQELRAFLEPLFKQMAPDFILDVHQAHELGEPEIAADVVILDINVEKRNGAIINALHLWADAPPIFAIYPGHSPQIIGQLKQRGIRECVMLPESTKHQHSEIMRKFLESNLERHLPVPAQL